MREVVDRRAKLLTEIVPVRYVVGVPKNRNVRVKLLERVLGVLKYRVSMLVEH